MNNNRDFRIQKAQETLQIIEQGSYTIDNVVININQQIKQSVKDAVLYSPDSFKQLLNDAEREISTRNFNTLISVKNCTSMAAAEEIGNKQGKIACLNFASAKNPGGGFQSGAQAQEESLARASSLYPTLTKYFSEMYEYNRSRKTLLYSDYMIYSPNVVFFKNDADILLEKPYTMDILTSPAVNIGAMKQNSEEILLAEETMLSRIDKILSVFLMQKVENIILGAWGCGVFQNNPQDVARYFAHFLKEGGKYERCFKTVVFAVFDKSINLQNITPFNSKFLY